MVVRHSLPMMAAVCMALASCGGPKVLTDDDKRQLQQVRTIEINQTLDLRTTPDDDDKGWRTIEPTLTEKIQKAGLAVAGRGQAADATLSVYVTFVKIRPLGSPPPPPGSKEPSSLLIDLRLSHKSVGRIFSYIATAPAPYAINVPQTELIRDFDQILLRKLYKQP